MMTSLFMVFVIVPKHQIYLFQFHRAKDASRQVVLYCHLCDDMLSNNEGPAAEAECGHEVRILNANRAIIVRLSRQLLLGAQFTVVPVDLQPLPVRWLVEDCRQQIQIEFRPDAEVRVVRADLQTVQPPDAAVTVIGHLAFWLLDRRRQPVRQLVLEVKSVPLRLKRYKTK